MKNKFALIGGKLGHSFSPIIHKKIFEKLNIEGNYNLLELAKNELPLVIEKLRLGELKGINVTIPYKSEIIKYLDEISEEAKSIGAVNTIISRNGKLIGYNTDYYGFKMTVKSLNLEIKDKKNFICGAGGSARAVIKCLEDLDSKNYLVTRDVEKARSNFMNFKDLEIIDYDSLKEIKDKNLIVNCTPCGMYPNIDCSILKDGEAKEYKGGIDIIYNPEKTKFLEGFEIYSNGLLMLIGQAIKAEEIWLDREINGEIVEEILVVLKKKIN
jgi:shikimate dehydrogenase